MNTNPATIDDAIDDLVREKHLIETAIDGLEALKQLYGHGGRLNPTATRVLPATSSTVLPPPVVQPEAITATSRKPAKRKYTRRVAAAAVSSLRVKPHRAIDPMRPDKRISQPAKGGGMKRCQACKQMRNAETEFEMGEFRKKRRCVVCEPPLAKTGDKPSDPDPRPAAGPENRVTGSTNDYESTFRKIAAASKPRAEAAPKPEVVSPKFRSEFGDELEYSKPITCPKCKAPGVRFSRQEDCDKSTDHWTCLKNGCQVRISHIVLSVDHKYDPILEEAV